MRELHFRQYESKNISAKIALNSIITYNDHICTINTYDEARQKNPDNRKLAGVTSNRISVPGSD